MRELEEHAPAWVAVQFQAKGFKESRVKRSFQPPGMCFPLSEALYSPQGQPIVALVEIYQRGLPEVCASTELVQRR